ncbi:hypothetical protein LZU85_15820 [Vibrio sp. IRLE0018]|uniref:hypothetical protein n=1 Tax=Vibrio TaxID=662 RepID=UPI001592DC7B|nr:MULTISPECIES: hypothetical protein [Vibrio]MCF8780278.1 hypothetical protein [Vibrio floridensis]HAS6348991.1 hypothetical protein [Vibrio vulnificus]
MIQEVEGKPKIIRKMANNTFGKESLKNKWNIGALNECNTVLATYVAVQKATA